MKRSGHSKTKANDLSIVYLTTESKPCSFKGRETNGRSGRHSQIGLTVEGSLRQLAESPCGTGNLTGDPELGEA